jgi:hypothetical protein
LPRNKAEWVAKGWASLELISSIAIFFLGVWIASVIPDAGVFKWILSITVSFLLALFLPSMLFGIPTVRLMWKVQGRDVASGNATADLTIENPHLSAPEIGFRIDLVASHSSVLGWLLLASAKKKKFVVVVEASPPGIVRIKTQIASPGTALLKDKSLISFALVSSDYGSRQARFIGSFVPAMLTSGWDDMQITAKLFDAKAHKRRHRVKVDCGITGISVRSS